MTARSGPNEHSSPQLLVLEILRVFCTMVPDHTQVVAGNNEISSGTGRTGASRSVCQAQAVSHLTYD